MADKLSDSDPPYVIAPLPVEQGQPLPERPDITQYGDPSGDSPVLNLFLQAMTRLMENGNLDDKKSYFRLAAIHGAPYVEWDGVRSPGEDMSTGGGFCVHNNVTFPTWHRVYMMLFEQRVWETMADIVSTMSPEDQKTYGPIQQYWRLPYWNWGIAGPGYNIPQIFTADTIVGNPNPMVKYTNPVKDESGSPAQFGSDYMSKKKWGNDYRILQQPDPHPRWDLTAATSRWCPSTVSLTDKAWIDGVNDNGLLTLEFDGPSDWYPPNPSSTDHPTGYLSDLVAQLFSTDYTNYASFASTKWYPTMEAAEAINLEYIHNNVHNFTGGCNLRDYSLSGVGHMNDVPVAAFDPIFWHHHCFIDELFAKWQMLHPEHWFDKPFTPPPDSGLMPDPLPTAKLPPFHKDLRREFWTSDDVRDTSKLGYSYPDLKDLSALKRHINKNFAVTRSYAIKANEMGGRNNHYVLNVIYNRYALDVPYTIYFHFANVPTKDPGKPNWVGVVSTFGGGNAACENCVSQKDAKVLSRAQVLLNVPLFQLALDEKENALPHKNLKLGDGKNGGIWKFLKDNLRYSIVDNAGNTVANDDEKMTDLKITALVGHARHDTSDSELSQYAGYQHFFTLHQGGFSDENLWNTEPVTDQNPWQDDIWV